jgi:hypothetical protein
VSFPFDVFVSYAHADEDRDFAVRLARALGQAGFSIWLDEEQMLAGDPVDRRLTKALEQAQHAVFVVTDAWLDRPYTQWELTIFSKERSETRRLVPILRIPRDAKRIGPILNELDAAEWPPVDPEPEAAHLWFIRCSLLGQPPGPRAEWADNWRQVTNVNGPALMAKTPAEATARALSALDRGHAREALSCDRDPQWGQLAAYADRRFHQAIFVIGSQGMGHEFFLERVHRCLPTQPPRAILAVRWTVSIPNTKGLFLDAIARALRCPAETVVEVLRAQLAGQDLVIVHRPVCERDFEDEALASYYTTWLPELFAKVDGAGEPDGHKGTVKVVQAIAWYSANRVRTAVARLASVAGVQRSWVEEALQTEAAKQAIATICAAAEDRRKARLPWIPIAALDELAEISRQHVWKCCEFILPPAERDRFVDRVMLGAKDSDQILKRLTEWLSDEESE